MDKLVEDIVRRIIGEKTASHKAPALASLSEILASKELGEKVTDAMRGLAIKGTYRAGIDIKKQPILLKKEQD